MPKNFFYFFIFTVFSLNAANPVYKIYDLGTLETDTSHASAINDKGQVLGCFHDMGKWHTFIWEPRSGLKIIEFPEIGWFNAKLNNRGNFVAQYYQDNKAYLIFWNKEIGCTPIYQEHGIQLIDFNDNDKILIKVTKLLPPDTGHYNQWEKDFFYVWKNGEATDLQEIFSQQLGSEWRDFRPIAMNNLGEIAVHAYKQIDTSNGVNIIYKSFLFTNGKFRMILPQAELDSNVQIMALDDQKNMIVSIANTQYYINSEMRFKARVFNNYCNVLRNGLPLQIGQLPGKLKKDENGEFYVVPGISIGKLLITQESHLPFLLPHYSLEVQGQNSKGWVIGSMDTIHSSYHAFIAVPEDEIMRNENKKGDLIIIE